jgi:ribosomal protein L11 methyltransferase
VSAFLSVHCSIPWTSEEELPTLFAEAPVLGTEIGERRGGRVDVTVYLSGSERAGAGAIESLLRTCGGDDIEIETVAEEDWLANYREVVQPFAVGETWWLDPHPDTPTPAPPDRKRLAIPPRMAFGSGSHESTRLVLHALETADLKGRNVFDVGTGSGILALAADALGASRVLGVDIDSVAIAVACEIRSLQEWRPGVHYVAGSVECALGGSFDMVMCNMISAHFTPLLDDMATALAPGGLLVLSGLLVSEIEGLALDLRRRDLHIESTDSLGEWASIRAGRRR